ncbi:uncharacterized protein METZ01_LOCUS107634, partial [marine metagenome]
NNAIRDTVWFRNCTFKKNYVDDSGVSQGGYGTQGGAIWLDFGMNLVIVNSLFEENQAIQKEGTNGAYGGAIQISSSWSGQFRPYVWIANSRFTKNKVDHTGSNSGTNGGAINAGAPFIMVNTLIDSNSALFSGSNGRGHGGGITVSMNSQWDNQNNEIKGYNYLINNTIVNNYAGSSSDQGEGGGLVIQNANNINGTWFNNIFWGNRTNRTEKSMADNIVVQYAGQASGSDFQLNRSHNDIEFSSQESWGSNSYDMDPSFYSSTNYQLSPGSALIGAGIATFDGVAGPTFDKLGNARPNPSGSSPDLGAYENSLAVSPYPKQVTNMVGIPGGGQVTLSWDANTETDLDKYVIYTSTVQGFTPAKEDSVGETTATVYNVTGLTNNTEYYFRVAAVNTSGYRGTFSQELSVIPEYKGPVWWVDDVNGDNNGDGSSISPLLSISQALTVAAAGDTIKLLPGNYGDGNTNLNVNKSISIIGVEGPDQTIIDGGDNKLHFFFNGEDVDGEVVVRLKGIQFTNGRRFDENGNESSPGSFIAWRVDSLFVTDCVFRNNRARNSGGVMVLHSTESVFRNVDFVDNAAGSSDNDEWANGGVFSINGEENAEIVTAKFIGCLFERNRVSVGGSNSGGSGGIFNQYMGARAVFIDSEFKNNYIRANSSDSWVDAAIFRGNHHDVGSYTNYPAGSNQPYLPTVFNRCLFKDNYVDNANYVSGVLFNTAQPLKVINSVFINNHANGNNNSGTLFRSDPSPDGNDQGPVIEYINNTITNNSGFSELYAGVGFKSSIRFENNIVWDNSSPHLWVSTDDGNVLTASNNILDANAQGDYVSVDNINLNPKFKNPSSGNYQLSNNSPAIDAGLPNEIKVDYRSYYRVGTPDIGAFESGASKYFLAMVDDITEDKDTTFVELSQELKITVTTGDIDGSLVSSNETMTWNVFPNQKYVQFVSGDENTEGGDASATFSVTSQTRGKGFRFRIEAGVGDAFIRSGMYVIEELVTGAPPPVLSLSISPSDWTSDPNFTLSWETPTWAAQRDLIGAVVEVTDGISTYNQYMGFPSGDTLTNYSFTAPEAGQYDASLWLIDELGNEDKD